MEREQNNHLQMWRSKKEENKAFSVPAVGSLWITAGRLALDIGERIKEPWHNLLGEPSCLMNRLEKLLLVGMHIDLILSSGEWARQALRFLPTLFSIIYCDHPYAQRTFWLGLALQLLLWKRGAAPNPTEVAGTQNHFLEMTTPAGFIRIVDTV